MAYASTNNFSKPVGAKDGPYPNSGGIFASKAGSVGCKGEPSGKSSEIRSGQSTKGNAKKV